MKQKKAIGFSVYPGNDPEYCKMTGSHCQLQKSNNLKQKLFPSRNPEILAAGSQPITPCVIQQYIELYPRLILKKLFVLLINS